MSCLPINFSSLSIIIHLPLENLSPFLKVSEAQHHFPGVGWATLEFGVENGESRRNVREKTFFFLVVNINFPSILAFCLGRAFFPSRLPVGWYMRNSTILPVNELFFKSFFLI